MKRLTVFMLIAFAAGCGNRFEGFADREPSRADISGEYVLTRDSAALISKLWGGRFAASRVLLRTDGTFETSPDTIFGASPPNDSKVQGRWQLFRDPEGWAVRFEGTSPRVAGLTNFALIKNEAPPYELHQRLTDGMLVFAQRKN